MFWFHNTKTCNKPGKNGSKILGKLKAFYVNEWASFSTQDFPEKRHPRDGERVRIVMLDVPDRHPVEDLICTDAHYRRLFDSAGLEVLYVQRHLQPGKRRRGGSAKQAWRPGQSTSWAAIRVYDVAGNVIATHEHTGEFGEV
jgi:hypothetical protein